jgi:hypothetical protein
MFHDTTYPTTPRQIARSRNFLPSLLPMLATTTTAQSFGRYFFTRKRDPLPVATPNPALPDLPFSAAASRPHCCSSDRRSSVCCFSDHHRVLSFLHTGESKTQPLLPFLRTPGRLGRQVTAVAYPHHYIVLRGGECASRPALVSAGRRTVLMQFFRLTRRKSLYRVQICLATNNN